MNHPERGKLITIPGYPEPIPERRSRARVHGMSLQINILTTFVLLLSITIISIISFAYYKNSSSILDLTERFINREMSWLEFNRRVLAQAEAALAQVRDGALEAGIDTLLAQAQDSLNVRLIDNAYQLILKHQARLPDPQQWLARALALQRQAGAGNRKPTLGRQLRPPGGLILRSSPRRHPGPVA